MAHALVKLIHRCRGNQHPIWGRDSVPCARRLDFALGGVGPQVQNLGHNRFRLFGMRRGWGKVSRSARLGRGPTWPRTPGKRRRSGLLGGKTTHPPPSSNSDRQMFLTSCSQTVKPFQAVSGRAIKCVSPPPATHPVTFGWSSGHEPDCEPCRPQDCPRGILHPSLP